MKFDSKKYGELLAEVLLRKIETEEESERISEVISQLMDKGEANRSPEEYALLDLLADLVVSFEEKAYPMLNPSTPLDTLKFLMESNYLKQKDLVGVFGSQSVVSQVLNGKREINKRHAKLLAEKFKVSVELFI